MIDTSLMAAISFAVYVVLLFACSLKFGMYVGPFVGALLGIIVIATMAVLNGNMSIPVCQVFDFAGVSNSSLLKNTTMFSYCYRGCE